MSRLVALVCAGLLLAAGPASAQYIGIFMDPEASSCGGEVGPNPRIDLHVIMILEGSVSEFTGAQFMIEGVPESWTPQNVLWVPDVNVTFNVGNPMFLNPVHPETPGVNIAFGDCQQSSTSTRVPLGRIVLLGPPTDDSVRLQVIGFALVPVDPDCPFVTRCMSSQYAKACVGGGAIVLNGPPPTNCQVAVEERTWTAVKRLYG